MNVRPYLPSAKFTILSASLLLSVGLVYAAARITAAPSVGGGDSGSLTADNTDPNAQANAIYAQWQSEFASSTAFANAQSIQNQAAQIVEGSQTNNLTDNIGRSLLTNLTAAQQQGLGSDIPTQNTIISSALSTAQLTDTKAHTYILSDLSAISDSTAAMHTYGNALATAITKYPEATFRNTMLQVSLAVDDQSPTTLSRLPEIAREYRALAASISGIAVPNSFVPLELQLTNNYAQMAAVIPDMQQTLSDPVRGMTGIQTYSTLDNQNVNILTQIATSLQNEGILFNKGEAGFQWDQLLALVHAAAPLQAQQAAQAQQAQFSSN